MKKKILIGMAVCAALIVIAATIIISIAVIKGDRRVAVFQTLVKEGIVIDTIVEHSKNAYNKILERYYYSRMQTNDWTMESRAERDKLPEFKIIPAAKPTELTPAHSANQASAYLNWQRSGGDSTSSRFSGWDQINRTNVKNLRPAWTYSPGTGAANVQANPVYADGLLYFPNSAHYIVAVNAETGKEVWKFKPGFDFPAKRGMVWWKGNDKAGPRLYFAAGFRMCGLDAKTGIPVKAFGGGCIKFGANARVAPVIAGNMLVIGSTLPGMHAFDIMTGELLWNTDFTPANLPRGPGGRPSKLKGGKVWGGMALDEARGIAYVATGNPGPSLIGIERPGANENSVSVIAVNIKDGSILWSFQEIAHDLWDLDLPASPVLTTINHDGRLIDVVATPTKAGNTLLLDRVSGKPIFDFRLRRAPTSTLPGERTAPYQPDPELPQPFAKQAFGLDDVTDIGAKNRNSVLEQLKTKNFGFFEPHKEGIETVYFGLHGGVEWPGAATDPTTGMLYVASNHVPSMGTVINVAGNIDETKLPMTPGRQIYLDHCAVCHGQNREGKVGPTLTWLNMRFTETQVDDIVHNGFQAMPSLKGTISDDDFKTLLGYLFKRDSELRSNWNNSRRNGDFNFVRTQYRKLIDNEGYPGSKPPWGTLNKINLNTGKIEWRVPFGEIPELKARGIPTTGTENFGGPMVTAGGLVFASGTKDSLIRAFDSDTGTELWRWKLPYVGSAPPSTYVVNGRQYVIIPATGGGTLRLYDKSIKVGDAFVAFALPQTDKQPSPALSAQPPANTGR